LRDANDDTHVGLEGLLALVGDLEPRLVGLVGPPLLDVEVELGARERTKDVSEMISARASGVNIKIFGCVCTSSRTEVRLK
jgi:hypothetical protein